MGDCFVRAFSETFGVFTGGGVFFTTAVEVTVGCFARVVAFGVVATTFATSCPDLSDAGLRRAAVSNADLQVVAGTPTGTVSPLTTRYWVTACELQACAAPNAASSS